MCSRVYVPGSNCLFDIRVDIRADIGKVADISVR